MVSIITPNFNCGKFLSKTITSVLKQTYQNWEMIIVDDCSNDDSIEIINKFAKINRKIRIIKNEYNLGKIKSRNLAIKESKGRYIAFLDSDDIWFPNKLERQVSFMNSKKIPFTFSSYECIDESENYIGKFIIPDKITYHSLLKTNDVGCLTAIYDINYFGKVYMDEKGGYRDDFILWLELLKRSLVSYGLKEILAQYRIRNKSASSNKLKSAKNQWKVYRKNEKINILKSTYYFLHYVYYGFNKYRM